MARSLSVTSTYLRKAILPLGIIFGGLWQGLAILGPYANGWDAYFYLVQVKSLVETGTMHSPEWSVFYPLLLGINATIGLGDYEFSYQLATITIKMGLLWAVWAWLRQWKVPFWTAIGLWAYLLWSPQLIYVLAQYPKNILGVALFIGLLVSCKENSWWKILLFFLLSLFSHRLAAGLAILVMLGYAGFLCWRRWFSKAQKPRFAFALLTILSLGILLLSWFSGVLHWSDWERLSQFWQTHAQWIPHKIGQFFGESSAMTAWWYLDLFLQTTGVVCLLYWVFRYRVHHWLTGVGLLIWGICIFPWWQIDSSSIGLRLGLLQPIFLVLALVPFWQNIHRTAAIGLAGLFVLGSFFSWRTYSPRPYDPPYHYYARMATVAENWMAKPPILVIAHKGLAEYWSFQQDWDVMPWLPEYHIPADQLFRVAKGPISRDLSVFLRPQQYQRLGAQYFLLLESDWQDFLKKLKSDQQFDVLEKLDNWMNPQSIRPDYLLRRQKSKDHHD